MPDETEQMVYQMLIENTGTHMLDSGGAYGRAWQRNQGKTIEDFMAEPEVKVEFDVWEYQGETRINIEAVMSVFHFLVETCQYDKAMDDLFHNVYVPYFDKVTNHDNYWLVLMEGFGYWLENFNFRGACVVMDSTDEEVRDYCERHDHINPFLSVSEMGTGIKDESAWEVDLSDIAQAWDEWWEKYGDSSLGAVVLDNFYGHTDGLFGINGTINTYNAEDALSQTLQYTLFGFGGESYVLVQVHGGCDVRGGYTKPRVFMADENNKTILDNARFGLWVHIPEPDPNAGVQPRLDGTVPEPLTNAGWSTDDAGYHFYSNGNGEPDFDEIEFVTKEEYEKGEKEYDPMRTIVVNEETKEGFYMGGKVEGAIY